MARSRSLRLATEWRMPRSSRVLRMWTTCGRRVTSRSSSRMPSQTVLSRSQTTHLIDCFSFFLAAWTAAAWDSEAVRSIMTVFSGKAVRRLGSKLGELEAGHHHLLDLRASFDDLHDLGITEVAFHGKGVAAAVGAVDLHRVGRHFGGHGRGVVFGGHGLGERQGIAGLAHPAGAVAEEAGGAHLHDHVGEQGADELVIENRLVELRALATVGQGGVEGGLRDPHGAAGHAVAPLLQGGGDDVRDAEADAADEVARGDAAALDHHLAEHRGPGAQQAADRLDREPGGVAFEEEGGGLALALCEEEEEVGDLGERDPPLAAGDHVAGAIGLGGGRHPLGVASRVGLGEGEGAEDLAANQARQEALLLGPAPPADDRLADHVMHSEERTHRGAATAELLGEDAVGDHVHAGAAELPGHDGAEIALLGEPADDGRGQRLLAIPLRGVRRDLGRHEGAEFVAGGPLLGVELQSQAAAPCLRATRLAMELIVRKLSRSRSASSTRTPNSFSTKATSCMASSELTKPSEKMSSSGCRSWLLKNRDRNSLILLCV